MTNFSSYACYAALSACSEESPMYAFLQMVLVLVHEKKYPELDAQTLSNDFLNRFGFKIPYHPMQNLIDLGIRKQFFQYHPTLKKVLPRWDRIDCKNFMDMVRQKDAEYHKLLDVFGEYLRMKYSLYCSRQELSDQIQAFIQRYGLVSKSDKAILGKVKSDYLFAEYMLYCEESHNSATIEYIDQYTTGCAFAELLTFSEPLLRPQPCEAHAYLDSGVIFALLGMESKDRSDSYRELLCDMVQLGIKPYIFLHTYNEVAGIIDTAISWIGDPRYNPALASETAYYFVTSGKSRKEAIELLGDLKRMIVEDFQITIDETPYPGVGDIRTKYEADIEEMIVDRYVQQNANFPLEKKRHTIEQDARSLFMTLHFDGRNVAHTLRDVKNIFITTNRTLARVGQELTREIAPEARTCIPIALTDLSWGTLIWSNSPAKISVLNKANIISAAFAAFRPSEELLRKLDNTLMICQKNGDISPEKCYFLKSNTLALQALSQRTQNDEDRYSERMPFEILKTLQNEGFQKGMAYKQQEIDKLSAEKEQIGTELVQLRRKMLIQEKLTRIQMEELRVSQESDNLTRLKAHLDAMDAVQAKADRTIKKICRTIYIGFMAVLIICIGMLILLTVRSDTKTTWLNWVIPLIGVSAPAITWGMEFLVNHELTPVFFKTQIHLRVTKWVYHKRGIDMERLHQQKSEYCQKLQKIQLAENAVTIQKKELKPTEQIMHSLFEDDVPVVSA